MSIEALPNELLVQIFSYFPWKELSTILSLVNRRWCRVVGNTPRLMNKVTLHLAVCVLQPLIGRFEDCCIPLEVIRGSFREYRNFSIEIRTTNGREMGPIMEYCFHRWKIVSLRIVADHGNWFVLLQHHSELLTKAEKATIIIKPASNQAYFDEQAPPDNQIVLSMNEVRHLNYEYSLQDNNRVLYVVTLETPNLEVLKINRCLVSSNVHFKLHHCSQLRSICIQYESRLCHDPVELENTSPHLQPNLTHLKLYNATMATTFGTSFGNLHHICLTNVTITPTDHPLECPNLRKLMLFWLTFKKPLKIRTPQLQALTCNASVLNQLQLNEASQANRLSIDMRRAPHDPLEMAYPASFSFFRKLKLTVSHCFRYDNRWFSVYCSYFNAITELIVDGKFPKNHYMHLKDIVSSLTQVSSLTLRWMSVPSDFCYLPLNVKVDM